VLQHQLRADDDLQLLLQLRADLLDALLPAVVQLQQLLVPALVLLLVQLLALVQHELPPLVQLR
jgi:hypothetical protein